MYDNRVPLTDRTLHADQKLRSTNGGACGRAPGRPSRRRCMATVVSVHRRHRCRRPCSSRCAASPPSGANAVSTSTAAKAPEGAAQPFLPYVRTYAEEPQGRLWKYRIGRMPQGGL